MSKKLHAVFLVLLLSFVTHVTTQAQTVNITSKVNGFLHNHDCCSDNTFYNCTFGSFPDPRFKIWLGYDGNPFSFVPSTNGPGLYSGCGSTYGADEVPCSTWNPGIINLPVFNGIGAPTTLSVDLQSWEEDATSALCCVQDNCNSNGSASGGSPPWYCHLPFIGNVSCQNEDDVRCGRVRVADILYWVNPPDCNEYNWNASGSFLTMSGHCNQGDDGRGDGYGIAQVRVSWYYTNNPFITSNLADPSLGAGPFSLCPTSTIPTLSFTVRNFHGWTEGRNVKWQIADAAGGPWTDISGTTAGPNNTKTTYTYTPSAVTVTGSPISKFYRAIVSSDCGNTFTRTTTTNVVQITWYKGTDPFCAAPTCNTAYVDPVSGSDAGSGSPSSPFQTISKALSSGATYVRVARGSGTEPRVCVLTNNVIVEGGYYKSGIGNWLKTSDPASNTTITFTGTEAPTSSNRHVCAFKSDGVSNWIVKDLNIVTSNAPANTYATNGAGLSNYGFLIINGSSNYTLSRVNVTVGNAGAGQNGTSYTNTYVAGSGGSGGSGGQGSLVDCYGGGSSNCPGGGCQGDAYAGTAGTAGTAGSGGAGGNWYTGGDCNILGCGANGANGGTGGTGAAAYINNTSISPSTASYAAGSQGVQAITNTAYYNPGGTGANGGNGYGGGGGGGGGGGDVGTCCVSCPFSGCGFVRPNGGAGGRGGNGGVGGTGGGSGGGAFGIWRYNSNTGAGITGSEMSILSVGSGGAAGSGGSGSNGEPGQAGTGGTYSNGCDGNGSGGSGGTGGPGSKGGRGQDGFSGTSAKYVIDGVVQADPSTTVNFPNSITVDYYSQRTNNTGKACRNSEIDLSTSLGAWTLPAGLTIVNDLRDAPAGTALSSYTTSSSPIKVTTDNTATNGVFFDITAGGQTFKKGLYISTELRDLPVLSSTYVEICEGNTLNLSATGWDVSNVIQREWRIVEDNGPPQTLFGTYTTTSLSVTGLTSNGSTYKDYIVRYRELHTCCGWSRPVFAKVRVYPMPDAPTVTPSPNLLGICPGTTVSATFNTGNTGLSCVYTYEYKKNSTTTWSTYTPGTNVSVVSGDTSVAIRVRKNCGCGSELSAEYDWTVLPPFTTGSIGLGDQTDSASLCGSPTPTPNFIPMASSPSGAGGFTYQWYYKQASGTTPPSCPNSGSGTSGWTLISGATSQTYVPANGEVPAGYSRTYAIFVTPTVVSGSSVCGTADWASGCRKVTVLPAFNAGSVTPGDQKLCANVSSPPTPNSIGMSTTPTGSGAYTYQWYYKQVSGTTPTGCPSSGSGTSGWTSLGGVNGGQTTTYTPVAGEVATNTSRTYAIFVTPTAASSLPLCGAANWADSCRKITVFPTFTNGALASGDQTLCTNTPPPAPITMSTQPAGSGNFTYLWYKKTNSGSQIAPACPSSGSGTSGWTSTGVTTQTYTPVSTDVAYGDAATYALFVTPDPGTSPVCGSADWASSCRKIVLLSPVTDYGSVTPATYTLCNGSADPGVVGISGSPQPTTYAYSYQWYYYNGDLSPTYGDTTRAPWTAISGATGPTYDPPSISQATSYALMVSANDCPGYHWASGRVLYNILPPVNKGGISGSDSVCTGYTTSPVTLSVANPVPSGAAGFAYNWYLHTTAGNFIPTAGDSVTTNWSSKASTNTYAVPIGLATGTWSYSATVLATGSPLCDTKTYQWTTGNYVMYVIAKPVNVNATQYPGTSPAPCVGSVLSLINPVVTSGGQGVGCLFTYQTITAGGVKSAITPFNNSITATTTGLWQIVVKDSCTGFGCSNSNTATKLWTVSSGPSWTSASGAGSICAGGTITLSATASNTSGLYAWVMSSTPGGFDTTVIANNLTNGANVNYTINTPGTYYFRPRHRAQTSPTVLCQMTDGPEQVVVVAGQPTSPSATQDSPAPGTYCSGTPLTVSSPVINTGGTGSCQIYYQTVTPSGGTSGWAPTASPPTISTTLGGTYTMNLQTRCTGAGCNNSGITSFSWTIAGISSITPPSPTALCLGGSVTFSATASVAGNVRWLRSTSSMGADSVVVTSPDVPPAAGTYYYHPVFNNATCSANGTESSIVVYAQPSAPTATRNPSATDVCINTTLSLTSPVSGGGGTGTCSYEYLIATPSSAGSWGATTSVNATSAGTYTISIRRNCNGSGCGTDSISSYSWNVYDNPVVTATQVPSDPSVCVGQILTLTGVNDNGGGTGTCTYEYSNNGGSWSSVLTPLTATLGTNTISVRKNCNGLNCTTPATVYSWTGVAQPAAPTATKSPNVTDVCEGTVLTLTSPTDNGGGAGTCQLEYSVNGGSFSTTLPSITATVGTNTITMRKTCDASGCVNTNSTTYSWNVVADPEDPTATMSPSDTIVCSGAVLTLTGVTDNGGGTGTCNIEYRTITPSGGTSSWSTTLPSISSTTAGTYTIQVRKNCTGNGCGASAGTSYTWTVVADPTLGNISNRTICKGGSTVISSSISGGAAPFDFTWQYSPNGSTWYNIPGAGNPSGVTYAMASNNFATSLTITGDGSEATGNYYYRVLLSSSDAGGGCDATSNTATITVASKPVLTNPSPRTQTICLGGSATNLSVTASGGSGSAYSYVWLNSVGDTAAFGAAVQASSSNTYAPPVSDTGTHYYYAIVLQSESGCADTTELTGIVIVSDGATLTSTQYPNTVGVCEGTKVTATASFTGGSGCIDTLQYEYDSSGVWTNYTSGDSLSTTGHTLVKIRAKRGGCGCGTPYYYFRWVIADKPDASSANVAAQNMCGNVSTPYAILTANDPSPYTGTWSVVSGPGSISAPSSNNTSITNLTAGTTTTIRWTADNSGCSDSKDVSVTPTSTSFNPNVVATNSSCNTCVIKNGNTYTYYNASGQIVASITDYASPTVELGQTELCWEIMSYTSSTVPTVHTSYGDDQPYLPRRWSIYPATTPSTSHVTLYFKKAEFDALQTAAIGTHYQFSTMNDLNVTKFAGGQGGTFTNPPNFPATNASAVFISPVIKLYPNISTGPDYSVEFDVSNYSTFYVHPNSFPFAPLPVELTSFVGWNQGAVNKLQWETASEKNTVRFEVEKSLAAATWTNIGNVPAYGNTSIPHTYNLTDFNPVIGNNYYRLKIVDADGHFSYSNVINIPISEAVTNSFVRVYPNPTDGQLNIEIQATSNYNTKLTVYDVVGKKMYEKQNAISKGLNTLQVDFSNLARGTYVLQFADPAGKVHTTKFIKD